jgi:hypothetical protein
MPAGAVLAEAVLAEAVLADAGPTVAEVSTHSAAGFAVAPSATMNP